WFTVSCSYPVPVPRAGPWPALRLRMSFRWRGPLPVPCGASGSHAALRPIFAHATGFALICSSLGPVDSVRAVDRLFLILRRVRHYGKGAPVAAPDHRAGRTRVATLEPDK